jgi:hypothetical protein
MGTCVGRRPAERVVTSPPVGNLPSTSLFPFAPPRFAARVHRYYENSDFCRTLHPVVPMSLIRSLGWLRHEANRAWTIQPGAVPTPVFDDSICPRPSSDRSPCLSRLTFQPFHPQPPHNHFATVDFARYVTAVACRVYPPGRPRGSRDLPVARSRVRHLQGGSPTGSAESGSLSLRTGCSP